MHTPTDHPQFNESAYFQFVDPENDTYILMRIGNRINEGHAEVTVLAFFLDGKAGFHFERAPIEDNASFAAGGLRFEVVEPFHRMRVRYSGPLHILATPLELAKPAKEFTKNPVREFDLDLQYTDFAPPYSGLNNAPGSADDNALAASLAAGHYRVPCRASGTAGFAGDGKTVEGFGFRDHSWGPRVWNSPNYWRWFSGIADERNWFDILAMKVDGRRLPDFGVACRDGDVRFVDKIDISSSYGPPPHYPESASVTMHHSDGDIRIGVERVHVAPLRHRNGDMVARLAELILRCEMNGVTAFGFGEYQDRINDGVPEGMGEI